MSPPAPHDQAAQRPDDRWQRTRRILVYVALLGCLAAACRSIALDVDHQWDFRILYCAGNTWANGMNPYDAGVLADCLGEATDRRYVYPPDTLAFFHLFNVFDAPTGARVFLAIKVILAGGLFALWRRFFLDPEDRANPWFAVFCLFGLGNTLLIDLHSGNISILEQALLWAGLAAYLRGRAGWFCVLIWLAASFKLTLLAFAVLLLVGGEYGRRPWHFALVCGAMIARLALDRFVCPDLFAGFVESVTQFGATREAGAINPSSLEFVRDCMERLQGPDVGDQTPYIIPALYLMIVVSVGLLSWNCWLAIRRRCAPPEQGRLLVCLLCLAYALTVPRLKDYSCIVLLPAVWVALRRSLAGNRNAWLGVVAIACVASTSPFPSLSAVYQMLWSYQVLIITGGAWILFVQRSFRFNPDR